MEEISFSMLHLELFLKNKIHSELNILLEQTLEFWM